MFARPPHIPRPPRFKSDHTSTKVTKLDDREIREYYEVLRDEPDDEELAAQGMHVVDDEEEESDERLLAQLAVDGQDPTQPSSRFHDLLTNLLTADHEPKARDLIALSNLSQAEAHELARAWNRIATERRRRIVDIVTLLGEDSVEYNFRNLYLQSITDTDPTVRRKSIEGLWEDESSEVLAAISDRTVDAKPEVRAAAAESLGRFVYLAETNKLRPLQREELHDALLKLAQDGEQPPDVSRRALESLAYLSNDPDVTALIEQAYAARDLRQQASALLAMGRNLDRRWLPDVLAAMTNDAPELRFEAARASGELAAAQALPPLLKLLRDEDAEVRLMAIWALGQVGGPEADLALKQVAASPDEATRTAAQDALAEASL